MAYTFLTLGCRQHFRNASVLECRHDNFPNCTHPCITAPSKSTPRLPKQKRCQNRCPQAKRTLKITSPSNSLVKPIPKQIKIKTPSKHQTQALGHQNPSDVQANPKQSRFLKSRIRNIGKSGNDVMMNFEQFDWSKWWNKGFDWSTANATRPTPNKPQAKFPSLQANLRFQLAPKPPTAVPKQIRDLAWGCDTGVSELLWVDHTNSHFAKIKTFGFKKWLKTMIFASHARIFWKRLDHVNFELLWSQACTQWRPRCFLSGGGGKCKLGVGAPCKLSNWRLSPRNKNTW